MSSRDSMLRFTFRNGSELSLICASSNEETGGEVCGGEAGEESGGEGGREAGGEAGEREIKDESKEAPF